MTSKLLQKHCKPCRQGDKPLSGKRVQALLKELRGWKLDDGKITRAFKFENFHGTMEFVNAVAWIAHRQDHHPDMKVGYNQCEISYSTHSVGGLSENDFICAAHVDALLR